MDNIKIVCKAVTAAIVGGLFFAGMVLVLVFEHLRDYLQYATRRGQKSGFREEEQEAFEHVILLDETATTANDKVPLPVGVAQTSRLAVPVAVPETANALFVEAHIDPLASNEVTELTYTIKGICEQEDVLYFYLFNHPFARRKELSYPSTRFWLPLPPEKAYDVELSNREGESLHKGWIRVSGYR